MLISLSNCRGLQVGNCGRIEGVLRAFPVVFHRCHRLKMAFVNSENSVIRGYGRTRGIRAIDTGLRLE